MMNDMRKLMSLMEGVDLADVPQQRQRQDALDDQLHDLIYVANKFGMYDAADYLKKLLGNR